LSWGRGHIARGRQRCRSRQLDLAPSDSPQGHERVSALSQLPSERLQPVDRGRAGALPALRHAPQAHPPALPAPSVPWTVASGREARAM